MRLFDANDRVTSPPPMPIRVNGKEISVAEIAREIQNHPAPDPSEARDAAAMALVVRELLLQEAENRGLAPEPKCLAEGRRETEDDAKVRALLDHALALPDPTDAECRRFYEGNRTRFRGPTIFEASHILIAADPSKETAWLEAKSSAAAVIGELRDHPDRFTELARDLSDCPSAAQGGNLGQIQTGQTLAEFTAALEVLEPGETTALPVATDHGWHVIHLERRIAGKVLPYESVKDKIADYLADSVFHRAVHQFVALLAGQATIEGIEIERATSPLVQ
ncbi:MAG: peptidylprolyl isomerase [Hyphomicrobiales bacterium]|nr:peptidylprolyl isomerase [Hyphomicrobiales bacterium]